MVDREGDRLGVEVDNRVRDRGDEHEILILRKGTREETEKRVWDDGRGEERERENRQKKESWVWRLDKEGRKHDESCKVWHRWKEARTTLAEERYGEEKKRRTVKKNMEATDG